MTRYFCYTTVFNAIELFMLCKNSKEIAIVENVMHALKVLGLNGKSAKRVGIALMKSGRNRLVAVESLVAGVCLESRLPLLTSTPRRYRGFRSLRIVTPADVLPLHEKGTVWS
jgi:predicted nucleic acid-binding protein